MSTTSIGKHAEGLVVSYLIDNGFRIITKNWRTPTCEIDIIAVKNDLVHIIEVKFRSTHKSGTGFEFINKQKIARMKYAAQIWKYKTGWDGPLVLSGASVYGKKYQIEFIENISGD